MCTQKAQEIFEKTRFLRVGVSRSLYVPYGHDIYLKVIFSVETTFFIIFLYFETTGTFLELCFANSQNFLQNIFFQFQRFFHFFMCLMSYITKNMWDKILWSQSILLINIDLQMVYRKSVGMPKMRSKFFTSTFLGLGKFLCLVDAKIFFLIFSLQTS